MDLNGVIISCSDVVQVKTSHMLVIGTCEKIVLSERNVLPA